MYDSNSMYITIKEYIMKQLEREIKITYRWWTSDNKIIPSQHIEALDESAEKQIAEMIKEDYTSGELNDNIHMTDNDPEDGIEYNGWWGKTTKTI